jgi:hypothetical protein
MMDIVVWWSLFDSRAFDWDAGKVPFKPDSLISAKPYEVQSGLLEEEAFVLARERGLQARPSYYAEPKIPFGVAGQLADLLFEAQAVVPAGPTTFVHSSIEGFTFVRMDPNIKPERGVFYRHDFVLIDSVDGHAWGYLERRYYAAQKFRHAETVTDGYRDAILRMLPEVLCTRILALGEPARSNWCRTAAGEGLIDTFEYGISAESVSKRLYDKSAAAFRPGPEVLFGVFRKERWFGRYPFKIDTAALMASARKVGSLALETYALLEASVFDLRLRNSMLGAPVVKFEGSIFCGVSDEGFVVVVNDLQQVVLDVLWDHQIEDRYAMFELPSWLAAVDLSVYR